MFSQTAIFFDRIVENLLDKVKIPKYCKGLGFG